MFLWSNQQNQCQRSEFRGKGSEVRVQGSEFKQRWGDQRSRCCVCVCWVSTHLHRSHVVRLKLITPSVKDSDQSQVSSGRRGCLGEKVNILSAALLLWSRRGESVMKLLVVSWSLLHDTSQNGPTSTTERSDWDVLLDQLEKLWNRRNHFKIFKYWPVQTF